MRCITGLGISVIPDEVSAEKRTEKEGQNNKSFRREFWAKTRKNISVEEGERKSHVI